MRKVLLTETERLRDTVPLGLCMAVHGVCNDRQFTFSTQLGFSNFMNIKSEKGAVSVIPKEKLRVCYMVYAVSRHISPRSHADEWVSLFLEMCGISRSYYDKHRSDVLSDGATDANREYRVAIDGAIGLWHSMTRHT